jgi:hypothetical protein
MSLSLILACAWVLAAAGAAMLPSRNNHWPAAYALIASGLPLLVFVYVQNGVLITALIAAAGASILRWPLYYLTLWLRSRLSRPKT